MPVGFLWDTVMRCYILCTTSLDLDTRRVENGFLGAVGNGSITRQLMAAVCTFVVSWSARLLGYYKLSFV